MVSQGLAPPAGVTVQVLTDQRTLLTDQALVRLRNMFTGADEWKVTRYRSEAVFQEVLPGSYEIEVSAAGYGTVVEKLDTQNSFGMNRVYIVLKRDGSMPAISTPPTAGVPEDVRKDTQRGIEALKAGQYTPAERNLRKAYKKYPDNPDLNYLLGALYVQKKDFGEAKNYLGKAAAANPPSVRSLVMLGRVLLQQKDTSGAIGYLQRAVTLDPEQWMAYSLLATGYLRQGQNDKAEESARAALRTGKGAANAARLPLGQALAQMGRLPEAIDEFEGFVRDVPGSPMVGEVQQLIAQLKAAVAQGSAVAPAAVVRASASPNVSAMVTPEPRLLVPNWGPPGVDDAQPFVAHGVNCPEQQVIAGAAKRLTELIRDLSRFEATETVIHEDADELGKPRTHETRKYSYVAEFSEPRPGIPRVEEYRKAISGVLRFPKGIATLGLPGLAFIFYPTSRENFQLTCEGLGQWQQQATWLMHFRQQENRPSRLLVYDVGRESGAVDLKGRAWIAADTLQIVRIEAESIRPLPAIQLLSHHAIVDYGRVGFPDKNVELWLPQKAEVFFQFRGQRYHRVHTFTNFRLFSVDASQKVKRPPEEPQQ